MRDPRDGQSLVMGHFRGDCSGGGIGQVCPSVWAAPARAGCLPARRRMTWHDGVQQGGHDLVRQPAAEDVPRE